MAQSTKLVRYVYVVGRDELPEFSLIQEILLFDAIRIYFIVKRFKAVKFSSHFHAYKI